MNKTELINSVAGATDLSKKKATEVIDATISAITKSLKKGDSVALLGFGAFSVRKRAARKGRNPQTGEPIKIKASKIVGFKPGKALKEAVK